MINPKYKTDRSRKYFKDFVGGDAGAVLMQMGNIFGLNTNRTIADQPLLVQV